MAVKDIFHDFDYSVRAQQRIKSPWSGWDGSWVLVILMRTVFFYCGVHNLHA